MNELELHPLPSCAAFMFMSLGLVNPYVYRFHVDRWFLFANGSEWMLIALPDGAYKLVDNPF